MATDEQTPAAQWADLWAVYMHENRALTARAEGLATEVARLRAVIADEAAELPVWPDGAYQTPAERDVSGVRARLLAAVAEAQPAEVADPVTR